MASAPATRAAGSSPRRARRWPSRLGLGLGLTGLLAAGFGLLLLPGGCGDGDDAGKQSQVPTVRAIPNFAKISNVEEKKRRFFDFMTPLIEAENRKLRAKRTRLLELRAQYAQEAYLAPEEAAWLRSLGRQYGIDDFALHRPQSWTHLCARVDIVPLPLALVQAANESGWGTGRLARLSLGMYGEWCYQEGCGIAPLRRDADAKHLVEAFESVNASVRSYMHNLNTNHAYEMFRLLRQRMREEGEPLDSYQLATGLVKYSQRREEYVRELRLMLRVNRKYWDDHEPGAERGGPVLADARG